MQAVKVPHFGLVEDGLVARLCAFDDGNHPEVALEEALIGRYLLPRALHLADVVLVGGAEELGSEP